MLIKRDSNNICVMIVDDSLEWRERIRQMLEGHPRIRVTSVTGTGRDAIRRAETDMIDCVIIDNGLIDMSGIQAAEQIHKTSPGTQTILITDEGSLLLYQQARAIGINNILTKPFTAHEIIPLVEQVVDDWREEMHRQSQRLPVNKPGGGPRSRFVREEEPRMFGQTFKRTILMVHSPKGGVGKTTTTVNMAVAAALQAQACKLRVAVVDLNEFGTVTTQLHLGTPDQTFSGEDRLARNVLTWEHINENARAEELDEFMLRHPSGLWVVPSVPRPEDIALASDGLIQKMLKILNNNFDLVIIDMPPSVNLDPVWAAAEMADYILVVVTPDVQVIPGCMQIQSLMKRLGQSEKCYRIVNMHGIPGGIPLSDINNFMPYPMLGVLPYNPEVMGCVTRGEPMVLAKPDSDFARAVRQALNEIFPIFPGEMTVPRETSNGGLFSRIFGMFGKKAAAR